ncbi:MAG TPA: Dyp-type peroxidase [Solirubrobacteraceae bacterium]|jgi:deferrochelatase/peroxidase EfeB|nr:Dyp-type peroxidase [Solirubrobacteraceae bacterium]
MLDRRQFLARSGAAAIAAGALGGAESSAGDAAEGRQSAQDPLQADGPLQYAVAADPAARLPAVPFHGPWQAGIVNPPPPAASFVSFNVTATSRGELVDLLQTLTARARALTQGGVPENLGPVHPPADSGTLGPEVPADGLTVTVGVGETLFDHRFGIADRRPAHLTQMTSFPNDNLDPNLCGGDLLLQICAGAPDTAIHALRDIAKHTRGGMQILWRLDGFVSPARPTAVPRNHFGFMDGIANPSVTVPAVGNRLLWVVPGIGEPDWAVGGTYHVCRIIRMLIEFWDRVSLNEQQTMIGRYRASGNVLGTNSVTAVPDFTADPKGATIPLSAHIRLANPRTKATEDSRIFRRGYNYDNGVDLAGNLDLGLIFNCFQQNLTRQFIANQTRLIGEAMVDYISPVGGGYFFAVPGVRDSGDWYARGLFA